MCLCSLLRVLQLLPCQLAAVKWPECESAPPNQRPWFSGRKRWSAFSGSERRGVHQGLVHYDKFEQEIDRTLCRFVVVKRELNQKAKLSIYCLVFLTLTLTLTFSHELWVVTEKTRSSVQVAKMSFLIYTIHIY